MLKSLDHKSSFHVHVFFFFRSQTFIQTQVSEGEKNRQAMAAMLVQTIQTVAETAQATAKEMREMTQETLKMQMHVLEKVGQKTMQSTEGCWQLRGLKHKK